MPTNNSMNNAMTPGTAFAEDLRRFGLILLAAAVVGGFLQDQVSAGASIYAAVVGVGLNFVGYWMHSRENKDSQEDTA